MENLRCEPIWRTFVFPHFIDTFGEQGNITLKNGSVCNARVPQINPPFSIFVLGLSESLTLHRVWKLKKLRCRNQRELSGPPRSRRRAPSCDVSTGAGRCSPSSQHSSFCLSTCRRRARFVRQIALQRCGRSWPPLSLLFKAFVRTSRSSSYPCKYRSPCGI